MYMRLRSADVLGQQAPAQLNEDPHNCHEAAGLRAVTAVPKSP